LDDHTQAGDVYNNVNESNRLRKKVSDADLKLHKKYVNFLDFEKINDKIKEYCEDKKIKDYELDTYKYFLYKHKEVIPTVLTNLTKKKRELLIKVAHKESNLKNEANSILGYLKDKKDDLGKKITKGKSQVAKASKKNLLKLFDTLGVKDSKMKENLLKKLDGLTEKEAAIEICFISSQDYLDGKCV